MANCNSYQNLSVVEKYELVGKLVHMVQNDEQFFQRAKVWIEKCEAAGMFEDVVINPPYEENKTMTVID